MTDDTPSLLQRIEAFLAAIPLFRIMSIVIFLMLLVISGWHLVQRIPVWPVTTKGRIFVESPEVYTRERLVNDRFGQAFWLEQQLDSDADATLPPIAELTAPPFEHEFQIRSAVRAKIRQALLENQLDDRHDLTGNSVYGLKFDTSVIPGVNTRARAYVKVNVVSPDLPDPSELPDVLRRSLGDLRKSEMVSGKETNKFREFPDHYQNWVESIEWRLNSYLSDIPTSPAIRDSWPCFSGSFVPPEEMSQTKDILTEALSKVLAIDARNLVFPDLLFTANASFRQTGPIDLPAPWKSYVSIVLEHNENCRNWKQFRVEELRQNIVITDRTQLLTLGDDKTTSFFTNYAPVTWITLPAPETGTGEIEYEIFVERTASDGNAFPGPEEFERLKLQFPFDAEALHQLLDHTDRFDICVDDACSVTGSFVPVETGMYNFARDILTSESYLYTVFPKSDVSGVLERSLLSSSLGLDVLGKAGSASSSLAETASQVVASQVSFSDDEGEDNIVFGWVIGSDGVQKAVQKSQFVLLSLPVYLPNLMLEVESGWLNRDADFQPIKRGGKTTIPMRVALPPDYEAFDTLISGSKRYGPAIFDRLMEDVVIETCRDASILIPGARLWRSSQVTLAGEPADQIIVMPNMRGIMAHFKDVALRDGDTPPLQVWTSEGSDRIDGKITVRQTGDANCGAGPGGEP